MALSGVGIDQWAADILKGIGAPVTPNNIANISAWASCEGSFPGGGQTAKFNPLSTTLGQPGATSYNSVNVRNYTDYNSGLRAQVSMINQSNMTPIRSALQADAPRSLFGAAVSHTPWGSNGSCIAGKSNPQTSGGGGDSGGGGGGVLGTVGQVAGDLLNPVQGAIDVLGGASNPFDALGKLVGIFEALTHRSFWIRTGELLLGGLLLLIGFYLMASESQATQRLKSQAQSAATVAATAA